MMDTQLTNIGAELALYPTDIEESKNVKKENGIPFVEIAALGGVFENIPKIIEAGMGPGETLYKAVLPKGLELAAADGGGFRGFALGEHGIAAHATFVPVEGIDPKQLALGINPAVMCMAVAVVAIDKKLDGIEQKQQLIIDLFKEDKKSQLRADLITLNEIREEYMDNWDSSSYKIGKQNIVQIIKNRALKEIDGYHGLIKKELEKKQGINWKIDIDSVFDDMNTNFSYYKVALYNYSFATMLEIMLTDNYSSASIEKSIERVKNYAFAYDKQYEATYNRLEKLIKKSVENKMLKGVAIANKAAGKAINKLPVIEKGPVDEFLIKNGERLDSKRGKEIKCTLDDFKKFSNTEVDTFVQNINLLDQMYNSDNVVYFDKEKLYIGER